VVAFDPKITAHSIARMCQRRIPDWQIELALRFGKRIYARGSLYYFVGRRQVDKMEKQGYRGVEKLEGLTLVLDPHDKVLLTVFKNRRFLDRIRFKD